MLCHTPSMRPGDDGRRERVGNDMAFEVFAVGAAFIFGIAARQIGLPPLVGFLGAGFFINAIGPRFGMPSNTGVILEILANFGVRALQSLGGFVPRGQNRLQFAAGT